MPKGQKPVPTAIRKVTGVKPRLEKGQKLNDREPTPLPGTPMIPVHLGTEARLAWRALEEILYKMNVLTQGDGPALGRVCEIYAKIVELERVIGEQGMTYESYSEKGGLQIRVRPEMTLLNELDRQFRQYLSEFGLTPAARTRIKVNDAPPDAADSTGESFFQ